MPAKPALGRSPAAQETKYAGLMVNGIFRRSGNNKRWRQPPFTGIALACDKQKMRVTFQ
jgi:hypothetical protein